MRKVSINIVKSLKSASEKFMAAVLVREHVLYECDFEIITSVAVYQLVLLSNVLHPCVIN